MLKTDTEIEVEAYLREHYARDYRLKWAWTRLIVVALYLPILRPVLRWIAGRLP